MTKKASKASKAGSFSLMSTLSQQGFAFINFLLLVRLLPDTSFGIWTLYLAITSFSEMARLGFVQNGMVKFYQDRPGNRSGIFMSGLILTIVIGIGTALIMAVLGFPLSHLWDAPELVIMLWWYPIYTLTNGLLRFMNGVQLAEEDYEGHFLSALVFGSLNLLVIFSAWYILGNLTLPLLIQLQCISSLLTLFTVYFMRKDFARWGKIQKNWIIRMFHFGKYVCGTNFSSMLFQRMDVLMLAFFVSPASIAIYNVGTRIAGYLDVPLNSLSQVLFPRVARAHKNKGNDKVKSLYERSVGTLLAITTPIAFVVFIFARPIVHIVAGPEYADAAFILQIFAVSSIIKPWGRLFGITLDAIGKPEWNFRMLIVSLLINGIMNMLLIPRYGIVGAALGTSVSIWITIISGQTFLRSLLPVMPLNALKHVVPFYEKRLHTLRLK